MVTQAMTNVYHCYRRMKKRDRAKEISLRLREANMVPVPLGNKSDYVDLRRPFSNADKSTNNGFGVWA